MKLKVPIVTVAAGALFAAVLMVLNIRCNRHQRVGYRTPRPKTAEASRANPAAQTPGDIRTPSATQAARDGRQVSYAAR